MHAWCGFQCEALRGWFVVFKGLHALCMVLPLRRRGSRRGCCMTAR